MNEKLLNAVKNVDLATLSQMSIQINDLYLKDGNNIEIYEHAINIRPLEKRQPILDEIYRQIRSKLFNKDAQGNTLFHWAVICHQSEEILNQLPSREAGNINSPGYEKLTPSDFAIHYGYLDTLIILVETMGATINPNFLNRAAKLKHSEIVDYIIEKKLVKVSPESFVEAVKLGYTKIVEFAVTEQHVDLNLKDAAGKNALILALENNRLDIVNFLIQQKNIEIDSDYLIRVANLKHNEIVDYIIKQKLVKVSPESFLQAVKLGHTKIVEFAVIAQRIDLNFKDADGKNALILAAENGHIEIVDFLIKQYIDLNLKDRFGRTALVHAAKKGRVDIVKLLINNIAELNIKALSLAHAAENGHIKMVKFLIKNKADVNAIDKPLNCAIKNKHIEIAEILMNNGAKVEHQDKYDAVDTNNPKMVKIILENTREIFSGHLHFAIKNKNFDIVKLLLEKNPKLPLVFHYSNDRNEINLVDEAIKTGSTEIINILIKHEPNIISRLNHTLKEAIKRNDTEIVETFINHGAKVDYKELYLAIDKNNPKMVSAILKNINHLNSYHLNKAIKSKNFDIVKLLLEKNPNIALYLDNGYFIKTSLVDIAINGGNDKIITLLKTQEYINKREKGDEYQFPLAETLSQFSFFKDNFDVFRHSKTEKLTTAKALLAYQLNKDDLNAKAVLQNNKDALMQGDLGEISQAIGLKF